MIDKLEKQYEKSEDGSIVWGHFPSKEELFDKLNEFISDYNVKEVINNKDNLVCNLCKVVIEDGYMLVEYEIKHFYIKNNQRMFKVISEGTWRCGASYEQPVILKNIADSILHEYIFRLERTHKL